jgi:protein involved in polysaccharide export with SLBB domain
MTNFRDRTQVHAQRLPKGVPAAALLLVLMSFLTLSDAGCTSATRNRRQAASMPPNASPATQNALANSATPPANGSTGGTPGATAAGGAPGTGTDTSPATQPGLVDEYSYRLAPGDLLDIKFPFHPEENERVPVRPDGRIGLQSTGDVVAAGMTPKELEASIIEKVSANLKNPVVSVVIVQLAEHKVYVGGDVAKPGFVNFRDGMTPLSAIIERGGFLDTAKTNSVLYIKRNGDKVETQRIDLDAVVKGESAEEIVMAPDDIIFVPKTWIGEADIFVDQWVRGLLPTTPRPSLDLLAL